MFLVIYLIYIVNVILIGFAAEEVLAKYAVKVLR